MNESVSLDNRGIAWETDKNVKFSNPSSFNGAVPPPNWQINVTQLDPEDPENNGYKNEDLIVWMRTAALPTFRCVWKLTYLLLKRVQWLHLLVSLNYRLYG